MPKKKSYLTVTDQFCGAGGSSLGAAASGMEVMLAMNHWQLAIETHNHNFPDTLHDCADVSATDPRRYFSTDILVTSPECFPAGTLILTKERLKPIEDVEVGDLVLTHKNRWRPVTAVMTKMSDTVILKGHGHYGLEVTEDHPIYCRDYTFKNKKSRILSEPRWVSAKDAPGSHRLWASPVFQSDNSSLVPEVGGRGVDFVDGFWWMVGKWLADGVVTKKSDGAMHIRISCSHEEVDETFNKVNINPPSLFHAGKGEYNWSREVRKRQVVLTTSHIGLGEWLTKHFGKHAHGKTLPIWALTMPENWRKALLDGYLFGDGTYYSKRNEFKFATVSKSLAIGLRLLAMSLGYACSLRLRPGKPEQIDGKRFVGKDKYIGAFVVNPLVRHAVKDRDHYWFRVSSKKPGNKNVRVFNISVDEDESYVADGVVVHNCTNHSIAKGSRRRSKQMSLFGEAKIDPSAERSRATMFDVPRFAEYHNYNVIVVENVVDARHWIMWDAWIHAMDSLGYDYQIVYFNSQFAHLDPADVSSLHDFAPQSRDRMYVVFHKKGNKAPDLDFRPKAHCPSCDKIVDARQVFKPTPKVRQLGGRWGRYGDQYIYICESCSLRGKDVVEVTPFYFAAANAIDWSLPAERIGDRQRPLKEKTLERIRKGLEMFGNQYLMVELRNGQDVRQLAEAMSTITTSGAHHGLLMPLMIELAHGHGLNNRARPVSGQLFTQTAAQTQALLMPWLINTLHGDGVTAVTEALATQTARQSHALVLPDGFLTSVNDFDDRNIPMGGVMGTQTTQTKWALTVPPHMIELRGTNRPKGMDEPLDTIAASGNHHALMMGAPFLMSYYGSNGNQRLVDETMGTVTATERHALVQVPFLLGYANGDGPAKTAVDPLRTVHTENGQALAQPHGVEVDDCYFRMLQPHEIGRGMAFPETYMVLGNKREQVRQYGNAVTPIAMRQILQRCAATFN